MTKLEAYIKAKWGEDDTRCNTVPLSMEARVELTHALVKAHPSSVIVDAMIATFYLNGGDFSSTL